MTNTKRTLAFAAAASALLCLAAPHAQAAGPLFTTGGPVTASGSTLITFSDGAGQSVAPPATSPGDTLSGPAEALAPKPVTPVTAGLSLAKGASGHDGLPNPPKTDIAPEPSETAALGLGGVMLAGLALLARKRRMVRAS